MLKAVCIDDERLALNFMEHLLEGVDEVKLVASFQHGREGLEFVLKEKIDVVFLDIEMPEFNGLELAEKMLEKKPELDIVFVTAYNEYAVNAFEVNAIDYLMKPVKADRLQKTIDRLLANRISEKPVQEGAKKLWIRLGYNLSFALENQAFEPLKWRTAKARELFLFLLQNHGSLVHKGTLMEILWGEDEVDRGYSILYTTVYNIRKALQSYAEFIELQNTNDGYMLVLHNVEVDLHEWEKQLQQLPDDVTDQTIDRYLSVMELNSGPYLNEYGYIWVEAEKQNLENKWIVNAKKIARYYVEIEQFNQATDWLKKIVLRVPELEEAHLCLMKIYARQGKHHLVQQQYDEYVTVQRSYDLKPSPKVQKWFMEYLDSL